MHDLCTFKTQCHEKKPGCITFSTPLVSYLLDYTRQKISPKSLNIAQQTKL